MIAVGIDVSKSKSTIAIVDSSGEILMKPTDFMHNESSFSHLATILHSLKKQCDHPKHSNKMDLYLPVLSTP